MSELRHKMRILLTGAAGYVGSHTLTNVLLSGHEAFVVDNFSNSNTHNLNQVKKLTKRDFGFSQVYLRDERALREVVQRFLPDAVIHLAGLKAVGESVRDPIKYYDNNVGGSLSLL